MIRVVNGTASIIKIPKGGLSSLITFWNNSETSFIIPVLASSSNNNFRKFTTRSISPRISTSAPLFGNLSKTRKFSNFHPLSSFQPQHQEQRLIPYHHCSSYPGAYQHQHQTCRFFMISPSQRQQSEQQKQDLKSADAKEIGQNKSSDAINLDNNNEGSNNSPEGPQKSLSRRQKLQQAVKDYGSTVLVFHITMSLGSLGMFYLLVSSGLDMVSILTSIGIGGNILESKVTQGASTFVVAYAVHKVFAPVRITITLTATPFIVKKLRAMGILKPPKEDRKDQSK